MATDSRDLSGGSKVTSTSAVTVFTADMKGRNKLFFSLSPLANALTALSVEAKVADKDSVWHTLASAAGDYTSPSGAVFGASADLTTLAADAVGWCSIENPGAVAIRVRATAAGAGTCGFSLNTQ